MAERGSYLAFIDSMLKLRGQRLQEEELEQKERLIQQDQMMKMVGGIGESITSGFQTGQENQMANRLMQEQYGGGVPQDASFAGAKLAAEGGGSRQFTGGMPELKMRMAMAEDMSQADYRDAMINRMGQNLKFQKSKWLVGQASAAAKDQSKEQTGAFKDTLAYIKQRDAVMDALSNSENPEQYKSSMDTLVALEATAEKRGLKVPPVDRSQIAPFMSENEKTALTSQQTAVSSARIALEEAEKAPPGLIDSTRKFFGLGTESGALGLPGIPTQKEGAIKSAQELYEAEQQKLRELPGGSFYNEKPINKPKGGTLKEAGGTGGDTIELEKGTRRHSKSTGRTQEWDGTKWVDI